MKLSKFFKYSGISRGELAKHVGTTATTMGYYAHGYTEPSLSMALSIEEATAGLVTTADLAKPRRKIPSMFKYGKYKTEEGKLPPELREEEDPWKEE